MGRADRKNGKLYSDIREFFLDADAYEVAKRSVSSVRRKITATVDSARATIQQTLLNLFNNPSPGH